ncbi:MAG: HDOD domain-containing protein, partial [Comamonas sp.]
MSLSRPMDLAALLSLPASLPSQPRTVALLASELRRPEPSLRRLCQLFSTDPALAASVLASANGAGSLMGQSVPGVPEALVVLPQAQLRQLVHEALAGLGGQNLRGFDLPAFWRHSLETAKLARTLAATVQSNGSAAYALGLLHGLGQLHIHRVAPEQAAKVSELVSPWDPQRPLLESQLCGYAFSLVTAGLAQSWHLPQFMVDALQYMHAPLSQAQFEPLTGVLHLAAWRASTYIQRWDERQLAVSFPSEVGLALGLDIDMVLRQASIDWHAVSGVDVQV